MPIIEMPDGVQVQFPDEMPREQIKAMIDQRYPEAVAKLSQADPAQVPIGTTGAGPDVGRGAALTRACWLACCWCCRR